MISDSGCGIPEHQLLQIFNPYFTTKGASSGTGMGLYMSKMIVEKEMNGELVAENTECGARFTIKLKKMITERKA
jgi:signal transduction histidine kinase